MWLLIAAIRGAVFSSEAKMAISCYLVTLMMLVVGLIVGFASGLTVWLLIAAWRQARFDEAERERAEFRPPAA